MVYPLADAVGVVAVIAAVGSVPPLAYRDGGLRGLRVVGSRAWCRVAADAPTLSPLFLQPGPEAVGYTPIAPYSSPARLAPAAMDVMARHVGRRRDGRGGPWARRGTRAEPDRDT